MRNKLILKTPPQWHGEMWREGLPFGNGITGGLLFGYANEDIILVNNTYLWARKSNQRLPTVKDELEIIREMINQGDYKNANWQYSKVLKEKGYEPTIEMPFPLCGIYMDFKIQTGVENYRRILDMEKGEASVRFVDNNRHIERKAFVSRANDCIIFQATCENGLFDIDFSIDLYDKENAQFVDKERISITTKGDYLYYSGINDDGKYYGLVCRIVAKDRSCKNIDQVVLIGKTFVGAENIKILESIRKELEIMIPNYDELLAEHVKLHFELFNRAQINLTDGKNEDSNEELLLKAYDGQAQNALLEKLWSFGRYLYICGTTPNSEPMYLYGLWNGAYCPMWSFHMANENVQMINWHILTGGLGEFTKSLFTYYNSKLEDFKTNAQQLYGMKGIFIPPSTSLSTGILNYAHPIIMHWIGCAGWISQHFYDYCIFYDDDEMLKNEVLPFMREAALFIEEYLVKNELGKYDVIPSMSPENTPKNLLYLMEDMKNPVEVKTVKNATMDIAIIKELLTNFLNASKKFGVNNDELAKWQEILSNLPAYYKNESGAIKEWLSDEYEDNDHHRHLSHLYPVFPGREYSYQLNKELYPAFEKAVLNRNVVGIKDQSGWSLAHMANIYARLADGERAVHILDLFVNSCLTKSFFSLHNDYRRMGVTLDLGFSPFQLDANMGLVSAMQEMLLYSDQKIIVLLPALPERFSSGNAVLYSYFGKVEIKWDEKETKMKLYCSRNGEFAVIPKANFKEKAVLTAKKDTVIEKIFYSI